MCLFSSNPALRSTNTKMRESREVLASQISTARQMDVWLEEPRGFWQPIMKKSKKPFNETKERKPEVSFFNRSNSSGHELLHPT